MEAAGTRTTPLGPRPIPHWLIKLVQRAERLLRPLPLMRGGRRNAARPQLSEVTFRFADLPPAFDGYTLLHLSDLHPLNHPAAMDRAAELVAGMEVDLAVVTGDIQTCGQPAVAEAVAAAARLLARLRVRDGVFGILGNHDSHAVVPLLEAAGVRMLINEQGVVERGGDRLVLAGTDDVNWFFTPAAVRALHEGPAGFRIALVHSPELAGAAERAGVRLYLCGHTHGGQICLPGGWPLLRGLTLHRDLWSGPWRLGRLQGYTSRGTGVGGLALRYNCSGEVARITLRRG